MLTHELVHVERGPSIELDELVDALACNRWRVDADTAGELWVDLPTLLTRVKNLTDDERRYIDIEMSATVIVRTQTPRRQQNWRHPWKPQPGSQLPASPPRQS